MKITVVIMLILMPFFAFAQEHVLVLRTTRDKIRGEILGAQNGYLYFKTDISPMAVFTVDSIFTLHIDNYDVAPQLRQGRIIPLSIDNYDMFPNIPDSLLIQNNAEMLHKQQIKELSGIKTTLQFMAGISLVSILFSGLLLANLNRSK